MCVPGPSNHWVKEHYLSLLGMYYSHNKKYIYIDGKKYKVKREIILYTCGRVDEYFGIHLLSTCKILDQLLDICCLSTF